LARYEDFIWVGDGVGANAKEQIGKRYCLKGRKGTIVSATDLCVTVRWDSIRDSFKEKLEKNRISGWEFCVAMLAWIFFEYTIVYWKYFGEAQYKVESMMLVWVLLIYFRLYKRHDNFSLSFPNFQTLKNIMPAYAVLIVALVPIGLGLGFLKLSIDLSGLVYTFAMYFIFVATVEELMWRGVVQTFFSQYFKDAATIIIASILFGFTHIHKGGAFPNYPYVALATIAGCAYGYVFKKYGLRESILLHTFVDTTWHSLFK